jgi:hypothetical protein
VRPLAPLLLAQSKSGPSGARSPLQRSVVHGLACARLRLSVWPYSQRTDMTLWLPDLQPSTSPLLQAALDDRFFRIWEYEREGDYPATRAVKDEIDAHVAAVIEHNGLDQLTELAQHDAMLMRGSTSRGPTPYNRERDGARIAAWRQMELHLYRVLQDLRNRALYDPSPEDRAYATVPGLFADLDKRQLLTIDKTMVDPEWSSDPLILYGDHALFAHPLVRENRELLADLMALALDDELTVKLAVDPHAVVPRDERPHVILLDYWFGVIVNSESLDDPFVLGRTRHERRIDRHELGSMALLAIDISWWLQDDLKCLEVVETVPAPNDEPGDVVLNRYLHAMRDWRSGRWVHVDGAVRAHDRAEYRPTVANTNAPQGQVVAYRKLWRVDGQIKDDDWGRLLGHHFRNNELVIEAFGSMLDERAG